MISNYINDINLISFFLLNQTDKKGKSHVKEQGIFLEKHTHGVINYKWMFEIIVSIVSV